VVWDIKEPSGRVLDVPVAQARLPVWDQLGSEDPTMGTVGEVLDKKLAFAAVRVEMGKTCDVGEDWRCW
jgi:hypothetical protein